jgi:hypothetical protein
MNIEALEKRVSALETRNQRVELDKAWEVSAVRRAILIMFTYLSVGLYLQTIAIPDPWLNAIVPSLGFWLSTLTLPFFKHWWARMKQL